MRLRVVIAPRLVAGPLLVAVLALQALLVPQGPAVAAPNRSKPPVGDERILLRTNRGDLVIGLYDTTAPRHAAQLRKLVRLGVYDTTSIFRVEPGYLAQLTDAPNRKQPLTAEQRQAITAIPAELSRLQHRPGVVSMAHDDGDLDSARTSFSFMLGRAADLDGKYTIIGELELGLPLLQQLAREPREWNNRPHTPVVVEKAEVKSGAQLAQMRAAHQLRDIVPLAPR
jgi:cyclophilin family peptidyl-prolyl cis-trans isomerase